MRILHISANTTGGGEAYFRNFLNHADDYVLVELLSENADIKRDFPAKYISLGGRLGLISTAKLFLDYLRLINRTKPKIINAQDHVSLLFALIGRYLPFIHKPKAFYYTKHDPKAKKYFFYDMLQQIYFNNCSAVFCISDTTLASMKRYHEARFVRIYNGMDLDRCRGPGTASKTKTITFFGRLVKKKGIDLLIYAFNHAKHAKKYTLVIFGPEGDASVLQMIKNCRNTIYLGTLDELQKKRRLRESEIIVIPSRVEGFGYTALEALCARIRPGTLIVSDIGAFREILGPLPTYFKSGDAADLAVKLDYVISNRAKFKKNQKLKERIIKKFSAKNMIDAYLAIYNGNAK